ncbi:AAA family ATPase [Vineibacter terrae]|uniref:AAA family ATPase n=1 Tax=Vineibacter terrae TaxID=2586908 RepID=UPI002E2F59A9|nr:adenylate/guanylate cyclase domain-containing protein [Vineibacter terrae]HEX2887634.1 adenylate/guanylate cyclase domain-containing protein [Vineibacter terrae]
MPAAPILPSAGAFACSGAMVMAVLHGMMSLPMTCVGCGQELSPGFAFCPHCGLRQPVPAAGAAPAAKPLSAASSLRREADRRQVTILFADLCGFTALSERLDPEDVRAFQDALFEALTQVIARYGGFAAKFIGDAVLALFGAPVAHEDDPQRALDAALDMLGVGRALNDPWAARLGQPVALHIAVHTGPVVAGSFSAVAGAAYDVTGDAVNTASRLLGAAAPGTILVSAATHALTRYRFVFEPAGDVTLRGKAEPIEVHRLLGARAEPQSARGLSAYGLASPLVGRGAELDQLLAAFDRMQHGSAQVVSLVGEAGTGKSRLMAEFLRHLAGDDRLVRTAIRRVACASMGEPTYGVFATLFREGYGVDPGDSVDVARAKLVVGLQALGARAETAAAIMPVLSYVLGVEEGRSGDLDPEQLRRQIALTARMLIERRLEQSPLLFVIEDLHWADAASVDLLREMLDDLAQRPLMMVISLRPDAHPPVVDRAAHTIIRLGPLSPDETQALVSGLFGPVDDAAFDQVRQVIATRAGGNPLFVEEIIRSLVTAGTLIRGHDRWTCAAGAGAGDIPATLHGLLLSRIDRLSADARRLLQEAAVLGSIFDEWLLRAVATDSAGTGAALDRLVDAELIRPVGPGRDGGRYGFTHALVHEVVYENLLHARRGALHERAGRALESAVGPTPSRLTDLEALGHHWSLTADRAKGARYLAAAGDRARAVYANDDAIRHYARALRTLTESSMDDGQTMGVRERLADVLALTGKWAEALAHYETGRQALEKVADREGVARLFRKLGALHWEAGDRERAKACFTSGLEQLGEDGSPIERAQLFQEFGRLAFRAGDNAQAIAWAERSLAEAARQDGVALDPENARETAMTRAQAFNTLGVALARTGRLQEAVGRIEQSIALAEQHDLLQATCRGYTNLGVLYSSLDPPRSIETCLQGLESAKKVGDLGFQSRLYANLAVAYCALTDRCEAEGMAAAQMAIDLDRSLGLLDHLAVPLIVLGQIHQCHGDHALARAAYEEALRLAEQIGEPQLLFPCYDGLATLNLDAGDVAMAEVYLAKSQKVCERAGLEPEALLVLPFLC